MGSVFQVLLAYIPSYGYVALFFLMLISGTYVPVPGGLILLTVGAFARQGHLDIVIAFFAAAAGSITSDLITFYIARHLGKQTAYKKYVANHKFARWMEAYVQKYPKTTIVLSRFVGVISTPVNALTGLSQVSIATFLSMDALGNAICTFTYISVGYVIGVAATQSTHFTTLIGITFGIVVLFYIAIFLLVHYAKD